jgi:hypothetical protein
MSALLGLWRRLYGANPLHLVGHLVAFAISLFALHRILAGGHEVNFLAWFLAAAVLHDLVLLPVYSLIDRGASAGERRADSARLPVPIINYIRAPALISGMLLLVYAPEIFGLGERPYFRATGHHEQGYARNWLLISVALFLGSALIYAVRLRRATRA